MLGQAIEQYIAYFYVLRLIGNYVDLNRQICESSVLNEKHEIFLGVVALQHHLPGYFASAMQQHIRSTRVPKVVPLHASSCFSKL